VDVHLDEFVQMLNAVHEDGLGLQHFARCGAQERSTMPLTAFVYQFMLYNTLYCIDWEASQELASPVQYNSRLCESRKHGRFEGYLRGMAIHFPDILRESFQPLTQVELEGPWAAITEDPRINTSEGEAFFVHLQVLADTIGSNSELDFDRTFQKIAECRKFVYQVRNNIFHGTKTLGHIENGDQKRRIEIYRLFLQCLVSSFFAVWNCTRHRAYMTRA
jgi:hypothetical protein